MCGVIDRDVGNPRQGETAGLLLECHMHQLGKKARFYNQW